MAALAALSSPIPASASTSAPATRTSGTGAGVAAFGTVGGPTTDRIRSQQWQLRALHATEAWRQADGSGVTVAVIDSGVDGSHPDLAGQVLPGKDFVRSGDGQRDEVGHGTTVAGLIAGRGDDSTGVLGLAPGAKILPVRVLDSRNRYDDARVVANALRWAVDHGAEVVNLSLGGSVASPELADAIDYAFEKDVVVVACTGNESPPDVAEVWYPAREPGVLAVTGLARDGDTLWPGSLSGPATVLAAPGTDLVGARPDGYWTVEGTSFAAPLVTAAAALVRSKWPAMSAATVVNRLIRSAGDLGDPGRDTAYGFGLVDPLRALTDDIPDVAVNPLDTTPPPPGKARFARANASPEAAVSQAASSSAAPPPPPTGTLHRPALASLPAGIAVVLVLVGGAAATLRRFASSA
ncbi:MAG: type VII secretion-associated serine protease mycosin [Hamadaea sp.]|nr:type VII secretion-associated serine protease mycosin [Hamadaea sp.]